MTIDQKQHAILNLLANDELNKVLSLHSEEEPQVKSREISRADIANSFMSSSTGDGTFTEIARSLDHNLLQTMAKVPVISAIISTRCNQIAEFARPSFNGQELGFQIRLKNSIKSPNQEEMNEILKLTDFIRTCGDRRINFEETFESFIRMLVRDSLIYDQACFEVVRSKAGDVIGFLNVDSSTIKRAKLSQEEITNGRRDPNGTHYVQVIDNKVVAEFGVEELCFGVRRPRSDIRYRGYGYPELEELIRVITNMLNSEIYNASNFSNGINVNGILAVKTKMNPQLFRSFRREFYSMLTGANNSKKTPLIQLDPDNDEDVKAVNLSSTNKEMEFQEWMNYLIKIACSVYQIDPAEIGFIFGTEGSRNTLYNAGPSERVLMSKEKGLRPTLRAIESWINRYVIDQIDPRFELFFTGLDTLSMKEKIELDGMRVRTFMTVNEVRALHDLPPIPNGNTILDQNFNTRRFYNAATDPDVSYLYDVVDPTTNVFKDENKDKK
jgi:hypothetical protein